MLVFESCQNISKIKISHIWTRNNTNKHARDGFIVLSNFSRVFYLRTTIYSYLVNTMLHILRLEKLTDDS